MDAMLTDDPDYVESNELDVNLEAEEIEAGEWMNLNQNTVYEVVVVESVEAVSSGTEIPNTFFRIPRLSLLKTKCRTVEKQSASNMEKYVLLPPCSESCR